MAMNTRKYTITADAAATKVAGYKDLGVGTPGADTVVLIDNSSANTVNVGPAGTTDGTFGTGAAATNAGFPIKTNTAASFILQSGESLYVFAHLTSDVTVLVNGQ